MIRKYLVCGRQIILSTKKLEDQNAKGPTLVVEVLLPIHAYWETEDLLKKLDYLMAANEDPVLISELHQRILKKLVKYVVSEKDRVALQERLTGAPNS